MYSQILIGSLIIVLTVVIQVTFVSIASMTLTRYGKWLATPPFFAKTLLSLSLVILWLIAGISLSTWIWGCLFLFLGNFPDLATSLYFSIVSFTTLGFGDLTAHTDWRILSSMTAVNGLIIFGLNTAFLVEFLSRLRHAHENHAE